MDRRIRARIGAAKTVLAQYEDAPCQKKLISRNQANALVELFRVATTLTACERGELLDLVLEISFVGDDACRVMESLSPVDLVVAPTRRRHQQSYLTVYEMFTLAKWHVLKSTEPAGLKLEIILLMAIRLGLRCPSEPTYKILTTLWLVMSEPPDKLDTIPKHVKETMYDYVKKEFARARKRAPTPIVYLDDLPASPLELFNKHPTLYASVYGAGDQHDPPVPCAINVQLVLDVNASYSCRGGQTKNKPHVPSTVRTLNLDDSVSTSSIERFAASMMTGMQQMQQSQQKFMEHVCTQNFAPDVPNRRPPASFAALVDVTSSLRRCVTVRDGDGDVGAWSALDNAAVQGLDIAARPRLGDVVAKTTPDNTANLGGVFASVGPESAPQRGSRLEEARPSLDAAAAGGHRNEARPPLDAAAAGGHRGEARPSLDAAAAGGHREEAPPSLDAAAPLVEIGTDAVSSTMELLDILEDRNAERRLEASKKQKEKREAEKLAKEAEKLSKLKDNAVAQNTAGQTKIAESEVAQNTGGPQMVAVSPCAKRSRYNSKTTPEKSLPEVKKAKHASGLASTPPKPSKGTVSVEHSRSRVQCRSGLSGPGQNFSVRFGPGTVLTMEVATQQAREKLASLIKARGA
jgi:hypothetical protein